MVCNKVFYFTDNKIGPNEELGKKVIRGFLKNLAIASDVPKLLFFSNEGAKLVFTDDETLLEPLRKIQERGSEIAVCNTCIEYYHFDKNNMPVGRAGTAAELVAACIEYEVINVC
ncbi:hypothetical protein WA158_001921 [Blastocystis sp. Blastoise]